MQLLKALDITKEALDNTVFGAVLDGQKRLPKARPFLRVKKTELSHSRP
jgi:hypothetical protein